MPKKQAVKRNVVAVPQNLQEAAKFLADIGADQRSLEAAKTRLNDQVALLQAEYSDAISVLEQDIAEKMEGLFVFAEARRDELTESGKIKTVELSTGAFSWRMTPPAVTLKGVQEVLAELHRRRLDRFIRVKEEVDKEAMLREQDAATRVPGVTITQKEEFVVKPLEVGVEITQPTSKFKKRVG